MAESLEGEIDEILNGSLGDQEARHHHPGLASMHDPLDSRVVRALLALARRIEALEARPINPGVLVGNATELDPLSGMRLRKGD